jgi:GT2 family glycosyltransferase
MKPLVDVVVLTWNDGERLKAAVDSALNSVGVEVSVIVVDNGSDPAATVRSDARVTLLRNEDNKGVAAGRNQGALFGDAPFVCLLDSDARLHPDTLARMISVFIADPAVGLVAPVYTGQRPEDSAGRAPHTARKLARGLNLTSGYRAVPRRAGDPHWDVDFAIGACQLFRRSAYDTIGGIDESFFYGPEDVDFCLRLREAEYRVVQVADAHCDHPARRRFRRVFTRRGLDHAWAITRYLWRHRSYEHRHAA